MTNTQIIINEALVNEVYTEEQIEKYMLKGDLPLHTFAEWQKLGFKVKKGERARITTKLWKMSKKGKIEANNDEEEKKEHFFLTKAFLFTKEQVEKKPSA
ncbi:MAG: ssDNA-binding domain-containing protein [Eubacterium sp.]|nr:ssDNA-binding domain-containing protein [Eubacterium sp.]